MMATGKHSFRLYTQPDSEVGMGQAHFNPWLGM